MDPVNAKRSDSVKIRRAIKSDIPTLAALESEHEGYPAWGEKGIEAELSKNFSVFLVLESGGSIAAFMNFWIIHPRLELNCIVVSKRHLRAGLATMLMDKMTEYAVENGCEVADLEVSENNAPAIALYSRLGFRQVGRRTKYYNNTYDALLMRKDYKLRPNDGDVMKRILFSLCFLFLTSLVHGKEAYSIFSRALTLEKEGKYEQAMEYYRKAIELDPQPFIYSQALNLALRSGRFKEAMEYSEYLVKTDSSSAENWFLYGNALWSSGEPEKAKTAFERVVALDQDYADAYYQLSSLNVNNPEKAIGYLKIFMKLKPGYEADVYYRIALIYQANNDINAMISYAKKAVQVDPSYLKPRYFLASYYESISDFKSAIAEYESISEVDMGNVELINHIGELYVSPAVNDRPSAEKYFLKAVELDPANPTALYWLSLLADYDKEYEEAAFWLERSSDLETNPAMALRLSYYYTLINKYGDAITLLEKSHKKWPENAEIGYFLALGYDDLGRESEAYELLAPIVEKNPEYDDAVMQLGIVCEKLNKVECFEKSFRKLLSKNPENANVLNYLGYSLIDRGLKLDEAMRMVEKAVSIEPNNGAYLDSLGWGYYKKGDYVKAINNLEKSVRMISFDPTVWEHLGALYGRTGDSVRSWLAYKISGAVEKKKKDRVSKNLKEIYPSAVPPQAVEKYLMIFSPKDARFSSFVKVSANFKGKNIKMDGVLSYDPSGKFYFSLLGPLMAPVWNIEYSQDLLKVSNPQIEGIDPELFNWWAREIFLTLRDYFNGEVGNFSGAQIAGKYFEKNGKRIYFNWDSSYIDSIRSVRGAKFEIFFKKYSLVKNYFIPSLLEIKIPHMLFKVELDPDKVNIDGKNDILKEWTLPSNECAADAVTGAACAGRAE